MPIKRTLRMFIRLLLFLSIIALVAGCGGGGGSDSAPVITAQPSSGTVPLNVQTVVTVAASGNNLSYQWERSDDSGGTWSTISGATASSYSFMPMEKITALFRCTATNAAGSVTSNAAELTVVAVVFVNMNAAAGGDGTNWAQAHKTFQAALTQAASGSEIWVAAGTYTPGTGSSDTFTLKVGVDVYGGFTGSESRREARDWGTHVTTLSGGNVCFHVVTGADQATLDGFTVSAGNASATGTANGNGGGMYNSGSSPTVANCIFTGNAASSYGGGMFNSGGNPTVTECTFSGNSADYGGGMYNAGGSPTITGCTFADNSCVSFGGGMCSSNANPTMSSCVFSGNASGYAAGGVYSGNGIQTMINCVFSGNTAGEYGGGIYNSGGTRAMINCTLTGNTASDYAGGMLNYNCTLSAANCILWGNAAGGAPGQMYNDSATIGITYSCIEGGGFAGTGNIALDPDFTTDPGAGGDAYGDLTLTAGSPCIDAGDTSLLPAGISFDLAGTSRIADGNGDGTATVDMGAHEYHP